MYRVHALAKRRICHRIEIRSRSSFAGGCYDPIVRTPTLNGECLDDRHCRDLDNTVCSVDHFQGEGKYCVCRKGAVPMPRDGNTGECPRT